MRYLRAFLFSGERPGGVYLHPIGDGWRFLLEIDDGDAVILLAPANLQTARYERHTVEAWRTEAIPFDPAGMLARIRAKAESFEKTKTEYDREATALAVSRLTAMLAPPPRVRIRTNAPALLTA